MRTAELLAWVDAFHGGDEGLAASLARPAGPGAPHPFADSRLRRVQADVNASGFTDALLVEFKEAEKLRWSQVLARFPAPPHLLGPARDAWGSADAYIFKVEGRSHRGTLMLFVDDLDEVVDLHQVLLRRHPLAR